jgi:hypothetical protein
VPVVRLKRASSPSAVLLPGYPPSGGGMTPKAFGASESPKQTSGMRNKPCRKDHGFIEFVLNGAVVFIRFFFIFLSLVVVYFVLSTREA